MDPACEGQLICYKLNLLLQLFRTALARCPPEGWFCREKCPLWALRVYIRGTGGLGQSPACSTPRPQLLLPPRSAAASVLRGKNRASESTGCVTVLSGLLLRFHRAQEGTWRRQGAGSTLQAPTAWVCLGQAEPEAWALGLPPHVVPLCPGRVKASAPTAHAALCQNRPSHPIASPGLRATPTDTRLSRRSGQQWKTRSLSKLPFLLKGELPTSNFM